MLLFDILQKINSSSSRFLNLYFPIINGTRRFQFFEKEAESKNRLVLVISKTLKKEMAVSTKELVVNSFRGCKAWIYQ